MRLDKISIAVSSVGLIIFWNGRLFFWSEASGLELIKSGFSCNSLMHNSITKIDDQTFVFGEYGQPSREGKYIYKTSDSGRTWHRVFHFPNDKIRHIHNCVWDPYSKRVWVFTGDKDHESKVLSFDVNFENWRTYSNGTQTFRSTGAFVDKNFLFWVTDTPDQTVRLVKLNKKTGQFTLGAEFAGPAYYYCKTIDGKYFISTAVEPGVAVKTNKAFVYVSNDLSNWTIELSLEHDGLNFNLFRYATIMFPSGFCHSEQLILSFDAVKRLDGNTAYWSKILEKEMLS